MKKLYLIQLLFISVLAHAQPYETNPDFNRTRNWHFGHGVGLRFDPDTIYKVQTSIHTDEAAAVHTDAYGNLLLYSNGEKIWNANHQVIHNGNLTLGHHSSNLGSVFVFHEDNPDSIYLFNTYYNISSTKEFSMNLIVKEADTFRIAYKDSVLMYSVCEPIAVVEASNCKDIWITVQEFGANNFYTFLFTSNGIVKCPITSKSFSTPFGSPQAAYFTMVFSSNGDYLAKVNTNQNTPVFKNLEIYYFNSNYGTLEFLYTIDSLYTPITGICIGGNELLYLVERDNGVRVYEFKPHDSLATVNSCRKIQIEGYNATIQKKSYGKDVLLSRADGVGVIDNILFHVNIDSIRIDKEIITTSMNSGVVFPNFNQSYFYTPSINFAVQLNCITNTIQLYGQDTFSATMHDWLITAQDSNSLSSNIKDPLINFEDTGTYQVRYIATNGSRSDTVTKKVTMLPKIEKNFLGNDTGWCNNIGTPIALQAPNGMHCYEWSTGEVGTSITAYTTGTYWAKITTPNFCVIYDTVIISLDTLPNIEDDFLGDNISWCENLDSSVMLTAPSNMQQYLWSTGATTKQIEVDTSRAYWVQASVRNQCETGGNLVITDTIVISFDTVPYAPTIYRDIDTLKTNDLAYHYQWFKDEQEIGSNEPQLIIADTGVYQLMVSNVFGCIAFSDTIHITEKDTLIDNVNTVTFEGIKVYPNPFNNSLVIEGANLKEIHLSIYSVEGKIVLNKRLENNLDLINTDILVAGIYLFKLTSTNGQIRTYKFIKI